MLGLQEILIISAIAICAIVIPRMTIQNRPVLPRRNTYRKKLSGQRRLAVVASIIFPIVTAAIMKPWDNHLIIYLYIGIGPVIISWLLFWVLQGFRRP